MHKLSYLTFIGVFTLSAVMFACAMKAFFAPSRRARMLDLCTVHIDVSWNQSPFSVACGSKSTQTKKSSQQPLATPPISQQDSCTTWAEWGRDNCTNPSTARAAYDTLKHYIESCASDSNSWRYVGLMADCIGVLGNKSADWLTWRVWLKSVLSLNSSDRYYCSILGSLVTTYEYYTPHDYNASVALIDFELNNGRCPMDSASRAATWYERMHERRDQITEHRDTVVDSLKTPIDTTEPSLQSLGLDILLGVEHPFTSIVPQYTLTQNPFDHNTTLHFTLAQPSYAKVDVLDVLGREVWAQSDGRLLEPGSHTVPIELPNSPAGTYYLRLTLGTGEVRTIKMVKE